MLGFDLFGFLLLGRGGWGCRVVVHEEWGGCYGWRCERSFLAGDGGLDSLVWEGCVGRYDKERDWSRLCIQLYDCRTTFMRRPW